MQRMRSEHISLITEKLIDTGTLLLLKNLHTLMISDYNLYGVKQKKYKSVKYRWHQY